MDVRLSGYPLELVSDQFSLSQEFTNTYGDASDTEFIRLVYMNVLDREPDDDGYAYWLGLMDSGQITQGELMIYFSESAEYRNTWETQVRVVGAFIAMLDRVPTDDELSYEIGQLKAGQGVQPLIDRILASQEYEYRFWDHYRGPRITDQRAAESLLAADSASTDPSLPAKPPTNMTRP